MTIVDAGVRKPLELQVVVPVDDMSRLGDTIPLQEQPGGPAASPEARTSIWPAIHPRILELIRAHRSTIVFVNSRALAERLAQRLNALAGEELVRAHHGSLAREQREEIEEALKAGRLPALVATSSLELGIDMGAVDLVIQVESPLSVARGLQRVGRAGHQVGEPSRGVIFPKYRGDLLEVAVVTRAMHEGTIEPTVVPHNPLDVLAQQLVAIAADRPWPADELYALVRRAENFADLGRDTFDATLGMLAGQYPADEFADLKPRVVWDRVAGTVLTRRDARTVALISGGTIPDRGLFGVFLDDGLEGPEGRPTGARGGRAGGRRVGELDEEMVYEARPGEVILLGASAWRIERITHDRVLVTPAPGQPGKVPFWKGDGVGRPVELGRAIGAFTRDFGAAAAGTARQRSAAVKRLQREHDLDELAADNVLGYLAEEQEATGTLPTDRTIVLERFRDELGDWRICLLSPFGARVHAPWALAIEARLREQLGLEVQPMWSDDGIVVRLPATDGYAPDPADGDGASADGLSAGPMDFDGQRGAAAAEAAVRIAADDVEELVVGILGGSALFASRFRENAARALLLPRRRPGSRTPLWQMRQRAAQLLTVASRYGSFPIILETYRECLQDVFDLPALKGLLGALERREIRLVSVELPRASPFASSLLFDYIAAYMYEGDSPLADRRAQALALDRDLLRELLGADELRELLDAGALADLELELQALTPERAATSPDQVHDLLRRLGDLSTDEVAARIAVPEGTDREATAATWLAGLEADRRAIRARVAGDERWIAADDAGRYRDALGVTLPVGIAAAFLESGMDPLAALLARFARRHGPFLTDAPAARWGLPGGAIEPSLEVLLAAGTVVRGEFRPGGTEREWCDPEVLRMLRRRSLARLRREVEPVEPAALARFLVGWHGVGGSAGGTGRLAEVVAQLEGLPLPASVLEREILPARVRDYAPRLLDELGAAGEVAMGGAGEPRPGRWPRRALPAGSAGPAGACPCAGRGRVAGRGHRGPAGGPRRLVLSRPPGRRAAGGRRGRASSRPMRASSWMRSGSWYGRAGSRTTRSPRCVRCAGSVAIGRPVARVPGPMRMGPPEAAGRWSLVSEAVETALALGGGAVSDTVRRHALANLFLDRQGVVTRDGVAAEGTVGGFGAVYPVLRELEDRGRVRRGYFVEGLGGAQFALPGVVDRLRASRTDPSEGGDVVVLAATDPANPYGAALPWPAAPDGATLARAAGAHVVLRDGHPILYLERGGRSLHTLPAAQAADGVRGRPAGPGAAGWRGPPAVDRDRPRRRRATRRDGLAGALRGRRLARGVPRLGPGRAGAGGAAGPGAVAGRYHRSDV